MKGTLLLVCTLGVIVSSSWAANILFFCAVSTYSHRIAIWPMVEALAAKGHKVTYLSPYVPKDKPKPHPNITDYLPSSLLPWLGSLDLGTNLQDMRTKKSLGLAMYGYPTIGLGLCQTLMKDPEFLQWVKSTRFDIVVVDYFYNECSFAIAHLHGSKTAYYLTNTPTPWQMDNLGIPDESSWIPDSWHPISELAKWEWSKRLIAMLNPIMFSILHEHYYFLALDKIIAESEMFKGSLAGPPPSISLMHKEVSLVFTNYDHNADYPRPLPPNVIPVPGIHCTPKDQLEGKLPREIETFLGKDDLPFVYVSFGTFAQVDKFPEESRRALVNGMNSLKGRYKVLWKVDKDRPEGLGDHVYTGSWMPQQAILAHPKIKAFVSHAGLLSIQESICYSVPILAFPVFVEQDYNADKLAFKGIGIKMEILTIKDNEFTSALNQVLNDPKYRDNMKIVSSRFLDREAGVRAVDKGVWWIEYILRQEDTSHLRPGSINQSWWIRRNLDLWGIIFLTLFMWMYLSLKLIKRLIIKGLSSSSKAKDPKLTKSQKKVKKN